MTRFLTVRLSLMLVTLLVVSIAIFAVTEVLSGTRPRKPWVRAGRRRMWTRCERRWA